MKIKYKIKPDKDRPIRVGDKVRIKATHREFVKQVDIGYNECPGICVVDRDDDVSLKFGGSLHKTDSSWPDIPGCSIQAKDGSWVVPIEALEKVVVKKTKPLVKHTVKPVSTKTPVRCKPISSIKRGGSKNY